jgi:hypothetical protein
MSKPIVVLGNNAKPEDGGFRHLHEVEAFVAGGIFDMSADGKKGRYCHTYRVPGLHVSLIEYGKLIVGYFEIESDEDPTWEDWNWFPPVQVVYNVKRAVRFNVNVTLAQAWVSRYELISEEALRRIEELGRGGPHMPPNREFSRPDLQPVVA